MKAWIFILIGIVGLIFLIGGYRMVNTPAHSYPPKRPSSVPNEAIWSGGMDGGAWYVIDPQKPAPDVWSIKIYNDDGRPRVKGSFWLKGATNTKTPLPISAFDGHIIYLEGNKKMLPIGEHFYPVEGYDTKVIVYPNPSSDYSEPKQIGERMSKPEVW